MVTLGPAICFALVILSIAAMIEGYSRATAGTTSFDKKYSKRKAFSEDIVAWNRKKLKEKMVLLKKTSR